MLGHGAVATRQPRSVPQVRAVAKLEVLGPDGQSASVVESLSESSCFHVVIHDVDEKGGKHGLSATKCSYVKCTSASFSISFASLVCSMPGAHFAYTLEGGLTVLRLQHVCPVIEGVWCSLTVFGRP